MISIHMRGMMLAQMQPAIEGMVKWAVGFAIFSLVYFAIGLWVIRRSRAAREQANTVKDQQEKHADDSGSNPLTPTDPSEK